MSTPKFSRGPWQIDEGGGIVGPNGRKIVASGIALTAGNSDNAVTEANSRLIAAAPELFAALRGLCDWIDATDADETVYVQDAMVKARAAIAKAEKGGGS